MTALALIIGRAGSKGLAGKNARVIAGRPCVQWSILDARACPSITHVAVSTDGSAIADAARALGCEVLTRAPEVAGDTATVDAAARDALLKWEAAHHPLAPTDPVVLLYANVPVRPPGLIEQALDRFKTAPCDSVQSFAPVGKHHPWWTVRVHHDTGALSPWEGETLFHSTFRRQDLPPAFVPDGGVVVVSRRALMLQVPGAAPGPHQFLGVTRLGVQSPAGAAGVVDIDDDLDALVAEAILTSRAGRTTTTNEPEHPRSHA